MLVSGASRIGKTSLLCQLDRYLPDTYTMVRVEMLDEEVGQFDRLLWRLADTVTQQLNELAGVDGPRPAWAGASGRVSGTGWTVCWGSLRTRDPPSFPPRHTTAAWSWRPASGARRPGDRSIILLIASWKCALNWQFH
mgnify:CR=1 FL=1